MGTRFMCSKESPIHQLIKKRIVANDERETELIFRTMRNTSRVAKNGGSTKSSPWKGKAPLRAGRDPRRRRARQDGLRHRRRRRRQLVGRQCKG